MFAIAVFTLAKVVPGPPSGVHTIIVATKASGSFGHGAPGNCMQEMFIMAMSIWWLMFWAVYCTPLMVIVNVVVAIRNRAKRARIRNTQVIFISSVISMRPTPHIIAI